MSVAAISLHSGDEASAIVARIATGPRFVMSHLFTRGL